MISELDFLPSEKREKFLKAFNKEERIESLQLLSDFKYLDDSDFKKGVVKKEKLRKALFKFRKDYVELLKESSWSSLNDAWSPRLEDLQENGQNLTEDEIDFLKTLAGLEGDFEILDVPLDRITLMSRVAIYRCRVYALTSFQANRTPSQGFFEEVRKKIEGLEYEGHFVSFLNMLGDQNLLSDFCRNSKRLNSLLFDSTIFFEVKPGNARSFLKEFDKSISHKKKFLSVLPENGNKKVIDRLITHWNLIGTQADVRLKINVSENQFLLRVLQVKLWVLGLYHGELDHDFGPLTFKALTDYLDFIIRENQNVQVQLSKLIYLESSGLCAFNFDHFLESHLPTTELSQIDSGTESVSQVYEFVLDKHPKEATLSASDKRKLKRGREDVNKEIDKELTRRAREIGKNKKRSYKGKGGFLRFFARAIKWAKKGLRFLVKLVKKVLKIIKKAIVTLFEEVRRSIKALGKGFKFLFGKRIITTGGIATDYDFDFDGVTILSGNPTEDEMDAHMKKLRESSAAVYKSLTFVRNVIKWGLALGTGGWLKILLGIARLFKNYIRDTLKERRFQFG